MKSPRSFSHWLSALAVLTFASSLAAAQGIILPRPCDVPGPRCAPPEWQRPLRVKSIRLKTKITDQAAVTHVEQIFENESPYTLEGTYFFPLPDSVSISEFAMWDGDKRLVGEFRAREEARAGRFGDRRFEGLKLLEDLRGEPDVLFHPIPRILRHVPNRIENHIPVFIEIKPPPLQHEQADRPHVLILAR